MEIPEVNGKGRQGLSIMYKCSKKTYLYVKNGFGALNEPDSEFRTYHGSLG